MRAEQAITRMASQKEIEAAASALCDLYGRDHSAVEQFKTRAEAALKAAEKVREAAS